MLVAVPPTVLERSTTHYLAAPAASAHGTAWLRVPGRAAGPLAAAGRVGDALVVRVGRTTRRVVDTSCREPGACGHVGAPVATADGFAYGVVDPEGGGAYVATVDRTFRSLLLHQDEGDGAGGLRVVAAEGGRVVWVERGAIVERVIATGVRRTVVPAGRTGGRVTSLAAAPGRIAWSVQRGRATRVLLLTAGRERVQVTSATGPRLHVGWAAVAADGTVAFVRRERLRRRTGYGVYVRRPDGRVRRVGASVPLGPSNRPTVPRPAIAGPLLAFRVRAGRAGGVEALWAVDPASGPPVRIARVPRATRRLSDPAVVGRRVVWTSTRLRGDRLAASRVLVTRVEARP